MRASPDAKLSVLIPAKNAAETISECLASVLSQDLQNIEVLVLDDASTDTTQEIVNSFVMQDSRLRYYRSTRPGIVAALNMGLGLACSDLIARMDADDIMLPQRLSSQYHYLCGHPETAVVASQAELFPKAEIKTGYKEYITWQNACLSHEDICDDIYVESPLAHPSVTFRKQVVCKLGMYREGPFPEDYDLWLRMFRSGYRFHKLDSVHLRWRESQTRSSRTNPQYSREAFDRLRAQYLIADPRITGDRPMAIWGAGRKTRQRVAYLLAKGAQVTLWIDIDPKKINNKINGVWVRPPSTLQQLTGPSKPFVLSYVNNHGARHEIAQQLQEFGYYRGRDFLMVG
ncbi:MAG: glycosyltransferase family 2 protein [Thiohalomonadales bacterium]